MQETLVLSLSWRGPISTYKYDYEDDLCPGDVDPCYRCYSTSLWQWWATGSMWLNRTAWLTSIDWKQTWIVEMLIWPVKRSCLIWWSIKICRFITHLSHPVYRTTLDVLPSALCLYIFHTLQIMLQAKAYLGGLWAKTPWNKCLTVIKT